MYETKKPSGRLGIPLIIAAMILLAVSYDYNSMITAFIAIALIFWGFILFYIRPNNYVRNEIIDAIYKDMEESTNFLISNLNYNGKAMYYSPDTIWGLKNVVLIIPKDDENISIEEFYDAQYGKINACIWIKPPGIGLLELLEDQEYEKIHNYELTQLKLFLVKNFVDKLELMKDIEINLQSEKAQIHIINTNLTGIIKRLGVDSKGIGDPITSAIACILALSTKKIIRIEEVSIKNENIEILYSFTRAP